MANLPLTGSQYWGAALNNYLRQLNTDIEDLKIQLANFTIAASYSGSGWTEGTYYLADLTSMQMVSGNSGVYIVQNGSKAKMVGTLIFSSSAGATSVTLEAASNVYMSFDVNDVSNPNCRLINTLEYDTTKKTYSVQTRTQRLENVCTNKGFYPIYAVNDINTGFKLALNPNQEFVFSENYVLIGILERSGTDFRFIKKTDSAFKNLYTTRKENLTSFASIVNAQGLFCPNDGGRTQLNMGSLLVDYQSNGISERGDDASSSGSVGIVSDYKIPNDYKRFYNSYPSDPDFKRRAFMITYADNGTSIEENWDVVEAVDGIPDSTYFDTQHVYGIYISVSGDLFIEESAQAHSSLETLRVFAASTAWNLNANTVFRTAGLVLLGACYYDSGLSDWCALQAASNGISPEFLTNRYTENAEVIRWPSAVYSTNMKVGGSGDTFAQYKYEVYVPDTVPTEPSYIKMLTNYAGTTSDSKNYFELPIAPDSYYNYKYNSGAFNGIGMGAMTINQSTSEDLVVVDGDGKMFSKVKFISSTADQLAADMGHAKYNDSTSILRNTLLLGTTVFDSNSSVELPGTITGLKGLTAHETDGLTINGNNKNITVVGTIAGEALALDASDALTLKAANALTIQTTADAGILKLDSKKPIQCTNSIAFTSDRRCKHNIQSLDMDACVRAVRDLDAKSFTYNDSNIDTLGLIAQDIEELLPEYKDLLVHSVQEGDLTDKRTVSETKLLFILWQAVRSLLKGE